MNHLNIIDDEIFCFAQGILTACACAGGFGLRAGQVCFNPETTPAYCLRGSYSANTLGVARIFFLLSFTPLIPLSKKGTKIERLIVLLH